MPPRPYHDAEASAIAAARLALNSQSDELLPPAEAALAAAAEACIAAAERHLCTHCGGPFAEKWGDAPWHCFGCKKPLDPRRAAPEAAAMLAAAAVDAPFVGAGGALTPAGEVRHAWRGIMVGYLVEVLAALPAGTTTGQAVSLFVKPRTRRRRCRFVELPEMRGRVGVRLFGGTEIVTSRFRQPPTLHRRLSTSIQLLYHVLE